MYIGIKMEKNVKDNNLIYKGKYLNRKGRKYLFKELL